MAHDDARDRPTIARDYYRAIDGDDYDALADLLAPEFVHERPDRTLAGRERFVRFMREERPVGDTTHSVSAVYGDREEVAVRGELRDGDAVLFGFVDVFTLADGRIERLVTYTN